MTQPASPERRLLGLGCDPLCDCPSNYPSCLPPKEWSDCGLRVWQFLHQATDIREDKRFVEVCNHCGRGVSLGSGQFVNRVPDFNDVATRIANGLPYPDGDFVCSECDSKASDGYVVEDE